MMSGGSYEYAYRGIEDLANDIRPTSPLRKAFKTHLRKVAIACHDIEWVDSSDCGPGDEDDAIRACLGRDGPVLVLAEAVVEAVRARLELDAAVDAAGGMEKEKKVKNDSYMELIMAVGRRYPGESRHRTALRYIQEAERRATPESTLVDMKALTSR